MNTLCSRGDAGRERTQDWRTALEGVGKLGTELGLVSGLWWLRN
jgi:hypothetical protein